MKKLIAQYKNGSIETYGSISEAASDLILSRDDIRNAIESKKRLDGLKFFWEQSNTAHRLTRPVLQIDKRGRVVSEFKSIYHAYNETNICNIYRCVNDNKKTAGGYYWKYKY